MRMIDKSIVVQDDDVQEGPVMWRLSRLAADMMRSVFAA